ncbi:M48 family metalloprotease [Streptomyces jumonjinensis]|uniref:M48 family metalloprotease n=1 Tax=Streptomyces jumonjinensis TaxID=1945 RepID=UPI0037B37420
MTQPPAQPSPHGHPESAGTEPACPGRPESAGPAHPGTDGPEPSYPGAGEPSYPGAEGPSYPGAGEPSYPGIPAQAPPTYPTAQQPTPPAYPTAQQPAYPTAPQPAYPTGPGPAYPSAAPQGEAPATPPAPSAPPAAAPDHHYISTDQRRVHISAHQRRTDATAVGNLLLYLPNFLASLFVVALVSAFFGGLGLILVLAWLVSGVLVFHRPTESAVARRLLGLRYPTPRERERLEPVWREVTARAGVEGRTYELWIEDSDDLNAVAAAGHIVGVTRFSMNALPSGELAAVLAHELGHHVGGHAWSSLLGYWYALPGRIAWRMMRAFGRIVFKVSRVFSCFGVGFVLLVFGAFAFATISTLYGLPLLVLALPYALAAVSRRAELRADQHAAALGFAPMLATVLDKLHQADQQQALAARAHNGGVPLQEPSALSKLLSSHPDHHTRLHHLQPYLQPSR